MLFKKKIFHESALIIDDEFIACHFSLYPMYGMDDTVYNYYNRTTQRLPRHLGAILVNLNEFGDIQERFESISQRMPGIDDIVFHSCIKDLRKSGLLITKNEALAHLRSAESSKSKSTISTGTWITKDRVDSLLRSIDSFTANFKKNGHSINILVSDDSTDKGKSEELSNRLAAFSKKESVPVTYMGHRERRKLRDLILEKASPDGLPPAMIDFALFGLEGISPSHGANRNAVLLANAGEMILCTDDDVNCDLRIPESDYYDLELASYVRSDIRESFQDRDTLNAMHPITDGDILGYHNQILGMTTSEILRDFKDNNRISLKRISSQHLNLLLLKGGMVKVTAAGSAGDSGMVTPRYLLRQSEASLERCTASEDTFNKTFQSRQLMQSSSHFSLGARAFFLGMNMGIDNRGITPPFMPILRGEDTIFSRMINVIADDMLIGTLPAAITHTPVNPRANDEHIFLNVRPELCGIIVLLLNEYRSHPRNNSPASRLNGLGSYISDLGSLPIEEFEEHVKRLWLIREMQTTRDVERILAEHDYKPVYWADLLEKFLISIRDFSYSNFISAARDVYNGDERIAATLCRDIIRQYGELLKWWPAIFKAAEDIRRNK